MLTLVRQAIADFQTTGTVCPSSPVLARAMTRAARGTPGPKRILEVGPGSGVFTRRLLPLLNTDDELDIVEINPVLADRLEERLLGPYMATHDGPRVSLHRAPIQDAPVEGPYDQVVCGLPFNNFPTELVRSIFRQMLALLAPGGAITYYEYAGIRRLKGPFTVGRQRRKLRNLESITRVLRRRHDGRRQLVIANFPPAFATQLTRDTEAWAPASRDRP